MGKADLHIHSNCNDGINSVAEILAWTEEHTDLDLISITDHDVFEANGLAEELCRNEQYRFEYLTGLEITTLRGHLLAYNLTKPVDTLLPIPDTLRLIHEQGGIAIVPHPMSMATYSIGLRNMEEIIQNKHSLVYFDGIETFNPSISGRIVHSKTIKKNLLWQLPVTGGSDGHVVEHIGDCYTEFDGHTATDYLQTLAKNQTRAGGKHHGWSQHWFVFKGKLLRGNK